MKNDRVHLAVILILLTVACVTEHVTDRLKPKEIKMTLQEYITHLNKILENNPEAKDYQVVTSADDEGNSFSPIIYEPCVGHYEDNDFDNDHDNNNAVCVN